MTDRERLIEGLTKAKDKPLSLTGKNGVFGGGGAKAVGEKAVADGYLEEADTPGKAKKYRLTAKGLAVLNEPAESPAASLDSLAESLRSLAAEATSLGEKISRLLPQVEAAMRSLNGPAAPPVATPAEEISGERLRQVLRGVYEELCQRVEFRSRFVALPHLYRSAKQTLAGLGVDQYHNELERLRDERQVELHVLNEVHRADDPHLAIERDGRLYYYLLWKA